METSRLTLKELLRLSSTGRVTWISGVEKAEAVVRWVALDVEDAKPGDAILLRSEDLNRQVLIHAQSNGVIGIIVLGDSPLVEVARTSPLPVAMIQRMEDLQEAHRLLLTVLINQHAVLMEKGVRIHAHLSQLAAEGQGLAGLVSAMAEISGQGITLQDKRLNILASCPSSALQTLWEDVLEHFATLDSLPEPFRDRKRAGKEGTIINQQIPGSLTRMVTPVSVGGVARGYLSLVGEVGGFDALDRLVLEEGAVVCAVEMARTKAVRETEKRLKGDLLTALLQEDLSSGDAQLWIQAMGLDLSQAHAALRFAWDTPTAPSRRRLETLVNGEVARQNLRVIVNPMSVEVVCFCQVESASGRPDAALALGQAVLDQAGQEFPNSPLRCGVGFPAADLAYWGTSFRQAGQALGLARRLGNRKPLYFPDLSVYRLLLQVEHNPELVAFQEEILGPLLAYEGGEELIRTLEAFFDNHGNMSQTAEALYIHRNTLHYRMERISDISGLNMDIAEIRLAVQLALRIYRMMT